MGGFLAANAFLVALILVAAGLFFALGNLVQALGISPDHEVYAWAIAVVASILGTYYAMRWLHALIERRLMGKSPRR